MIVTGFLQARQSRRNAPNMTSQMAMITTVLPIAFGLFSLTHRRRVTSSRPFRTDSRGVRATA